MRSPARYNVTPYPGYDIQSHLLLRILTRDGFTAFFMLLSFGGKPMKEVFSRLTGGNEFLLGVDRFLKEYGFRTEKMYQPFSGTSCLEDPAHFLVIIKAAAKAKPWELLGNPAVEKVLLYYQLWA